MFELGRRNQAFAVNVKFVESALDDLVADFVWLSSDADEELVEVNVAVLISVKVLEKTACLALGDGAAEILEAPVEFLLVKEAVAV